jgi:hypothetical protein
MYSGTTGIYNRSGYHNRDKDKLLRLTLNKYQRKNADNTNDSIRRKRFNKPPEVAYLPFTTNFKQFELKEVELKNVILDKNKSKAWKDRIRINIAGKFYEILKSQLEQYPHSLLGCQQRRTTFYDVKRDEYFFDRNREAFEGILFFYQSGGRFETPLFIQNDVFYEEIKFFGLLNYLESKSNCDESLMLVAYENMSKDIETSMRLGAINFAEYKNEKKALRKKFYTLKSYFEQDYEDDDDYDDEKMPKNKYQKYIWLLFERPNSTILGRIVAFICLVTVIVSVILMCLETVKESNKPNNIYHASDKFVLQKAAKINQLKDDYFAYERKAEFFILELICNSIFTVEIVARIIASPDRASFFKKFSNIVDIIAVVPFWTSLYINNFLARTQFQSNLISVTSHSTRQQRHNNQYSLSVLRVLRLTRVLRILKLSRHVRTLNIMGKILYECVYEIILLLTFLAINIIIFSSLIYYIELHELGESSPFISIPHSFWWAVISFTTIGYGKQKI